MSCHIMSENATNAEKTDFKVEEIYKKFMKHKNVCLLSCKKKGIYSLFA